MITREAVEWCLYIGCLLPLITGYPFVLPWCCRCHGNPLRLLTWPDLGWLPWMTPAAQPGLHLTARTMRRVQQVSWMPRIWWMPSSSRSGKWWVLHKRQRHWDWETSELPGVDGELRWEYHQRKMATNLPWLPCGWKRGMDLSCVVC